jgi:hypothetical protein
MRRREAKHLLESGDIVDRFSMPDQKQPHRSCHGAHKGQQSAPSWSFIEKMKIKKSSEIELAHFPRTDVHERSANQVGMIDKRLNHPTFPSSWRLPTSQLHSSRF